ncbi:heptaprenyl diphosphate synthase component 1 [Paenibacillus sediminis]|uniref:Heptaprenyl diphosphate synthase n=1 Tax=Paenibacillus sediminis TaxID=664909 RepID=A0ABS4GZT7_9BACL|nr:heptaprenyl diphosphate synthase component 1 [Paenibacillus sediminis]MBP1935756.1 heptaprenyl diphosphate synthase [Paenibacillus sediminis]
MKPYRIHQLAKKYVDYDMIQKHTELPEFPDTRVRLLYTFLNKESTSSNGEIYALATSLVQIALDTHDMIDIDTTQQGEREMRSRQLKVLAGDYLSSRFYQILSQNEHIEIVSLLSSAICEVNRMKMNLYHKMKHLLLTGEEYLRECVQLRMQLFISFTPLLDRVDHALWNNLLHELTNLEVVAHEMKSSSSAAAVSRGYAFWHILEAGNADEREAIKQSNLDANHWKKMLVKYSVTDQLMEKLRQSVSRVQHILQDLSSDKLLRELDAIVEPFVSLLKVNSPALKEG